MASFRLILLSGSGAGTEYPLEKVEIFLGRDTTNDVVINDPEVSRHHARLVLLGNTYAIEDTGSTNGTFLRGQRLTSPMILTPGEVITIGEKVMIKFEAPVIDPNATMAAFRHPGTESPTVVDPVAQSFVPQQADVPFVPQAVSQQPVHQPFVPQQPIAPQYPVHQQPAAPQPAAAQQPVPAHFIPQQPVAPQYGQPVPGQPVYAPAPVYQVPIPKKKRSGWLTALLIVIAIMLIFCIIPWLLVEITDSYCAIFPGIFNAIQPGVCP